MRSGGRTTLLDVSDHQDLLIATIFGLGTAWFGLGAKQDAVITVVHTIVLAVYYWSFSPIGLASAIDWLDLEHTWATGVRIHFGVICLGRSPSSPSAPSA